MKTKIDDIRPNNSNLLTRLKAMFKSSTQPAREVSTELLNVNQLSANHTHQIWQQQFLITELSEESEPDTASESPFNNLPIELICKIFEYLDYSQAKTASLVCKKWRGAFIHSSQMQSIILKASNSLFGTNRLSSASLGRLTYHTHRSNMAVSLSSFNMYLFHNLVNLEFENDSADIALLLSQQTSSNYLLPKLKSLKIIKTALSAKSLIDLVNQAPHLESLELIHCDSLFMSGFLAYSGLETNLKQLKHLSVSKNRYLSDSLINFFISDSRELKSLDISYCYLTKSSFKSISSNQPKPNINSNVVLTVENLSKQVERLINLTELNVSGIDLFNHDEDTLLDLVDKIPNLERIGLNDLINLRVGTVNKIIESRASTLRYIDLSNSVQIDDFRQKSVEHCFQLSCPDSARLPNLNVIKMSKARINDPLVLVDVFSTIRTLTHLDLSCAMFQRSFTNIDQLNQFIERFANSLAQSNELNSLNLSYCEFLVTDMFVDIISKALVKLKHLDLRNCSKITDQSLHYICKNLRNISYLDLSWCQNISDYGLYNKSIDYSEKKNNILLDEFNKHLNSRCRCMRRCIEQPFMLLKIKAELQSADNDQGASNVGICTCKSKTPEATIQNAYPLTVIESNETISLRNLTSLKVLKLESCINISNAGLYYGLDLSQMRELDLKLCTNVNGDFIYSLIDRNPSETSGRTFANLRVLNLNQCVQFKEESILYIIENASNLKQLSVSALPGVTNSIIDLLLSKKRRLELFDVSFCPNVNEATLEKYEQFLYNEFGSKEFILDKRFISK